MQTPHIARRGLVPPFEGWRLGSMPLYMTFPANRHVSAEPRVLTDWVTELMAQHAPIASRRESCIRLSLT